MDETLIARLGRITGEERAILKSGAVDRRLYTDAGGFTIDKRKMLAKGELITLRPHTRFTDFPLHNHNYIEIMYVLGGSVTHMVQDQQTVALKAGELLFLSQDTYHAIGKSGPGDVAVNFIVLPQFFETAYEMLDSENVLSRFIAQNLLGQGSRISHLHFQVADVRPVQNLVENLILDILGREPNRQVIRPVTMGLLFLQLLNHTQRLSMREIPDYDKRLVIAILREIEENYRAVTLEALAKQLSQSVYSLSKLVKRMTGRTYKEVLQDKRFAKAQELLLSTPLSVAEIASYVGYENTSYFHRKFLDRFGMSPAAYRASRLGK